MLLYCSISHTTRPKREEEEQDGREYYFIDSETFSAAEEAVRESTHVIS